MRTLVVNAGSSTVKFSVVDDTDGRIGKRDI